MQWWEQKDNWFDCFDVLGIDENASEKEIKDAFRKLAKKYHPDNKETGDEEKYKKIITAYETLENSETKEKYIAFSKSYKKEREKRNTNNNQEENLSFEDIVRIYKEKENQIKIHINLMIKKVEEKEEQFSCIYNEFCNVLKNRNLSESEFEVRRQKLRTIELSSINSILEINKIINNDLKHLNLDYEKDRLKKLHSKFKKTEGILTCSYIQAIIRLNKPKIKFKKQLVALIPIGVIIASLYLFNSVNKEKLNSQKEQVVKETNISLKTNEDEEITKNEETELDNNEDEETNNKKEETELNNIQYKKTKKAKSDCLLFQEVPDDIVYDEMSDSYEDKGFEFIIAEKDGIDYLLDANNHHVIVTNFFSYGHSSLDHEFCFLGIDGYDYTLAEDLKTILEVRYAGGTHVKTKKIYLEGYSKVIKSNYCGNKYLIDPKTKYPLVSNFKSYSKPYYDEEFGCDVYCFTKKDSKCYVRADDITKVLKIEKIKNKRKKLKK